MKSILTSSLLLVALASFFNVIKSDSRIYGGYPIEIEDAPYMVYVTYHLFENSTYGLDSLCGGTIIGKRYVLTAGHCATDTVNGMKQPRKAANYTLRVGSTYSNRGGDTYKVAEVHPNPKYTTAAAYYDLAILKTDSDIMFNYNTGNSKSTVHRVTLARPDDKIREGDKAYASGWGKNPNNPKTHQLYKVDLKIIGSKECARKWGDTKENYEQHEVCALGDEKDVCQGDSGGPLIHKTTGRQIGLVSFGATCDDNPNRLPGVYTRIQDNLDFIKKVTRG